MNDQEQPTEDEGKKEDAREKLSRGEYECETSSPVSIEAEEERGKFPWRF